MLTEIVSSSFSLEYAPFVEFVSFFWRFWLRFPPWWCTIFNSRQWWLNLPYWCRSPRSMQNKLKVPRWRAITFDCWTINGWFCETFAGRAKHFSKSKSSFPIIALQKRKHLDCHKKPARLCKQVVLKTSSTTMFPFFLMETSLNEDIFSCLTQKSARKSSFWHSWISKQSKKSRFASQVATSKLHSLPNDSAFHRNSDSHAENIHWDRLRVTWIFAWKILAKKKPFFRFLRLKIATWNYILLAKWQCFLCHFHRKSDSHAQISIEIDEWQKIFSTFFLMEKVFGHTPFNCNRRMKSFLSGAEIWKCVFFAKSPLSAVLFLQTLKKLIFSIAFASRIAHTPFTSNRRMKSFLSGVKMIKARVFAKSPLFGSFDSPNLQKNHFFEICVESCKTARRARQGRSAGRVLRTTYASTARQQSRVCTDDTECWSDTWRNVSPWAK